MKEIRRTEKSFKISAPGKVILFGEHAVVYNKKALASAIDLHAHVELSPLPSSSNGIVKLEFCQDTNESMISSAEYKWTWSQLLFLYKKGNFKMLIPLLTKDNKNVDLTDYTKHIDQFVCECNVQTIMKKLVEIFLLHCMLLIDWDYLEQVFESGNDWGWMWKVTSEIPLGAGLGSSAAINVAIVSSIMCMEESRVRLSLTSNWTLSDRHRINHWSFIGERCVHGTPSGIDNTVSAFGGSVIYQNNTLIEFLSNQQNDLNQKLFKQLYFIILNTEICRSTGIVLEHVRELVKKYPDILLSIFDTIHNITCKAINILTSSTDIQTMTKDLQWLIRTNHNALMCLDVVHPSLDTFVSSFLKDNSLAGKVTGAGQGGCFLLLATGDHIIKNLRDNFPSFSFYSVSLDQPGVYLKNQNVFY